MEILLTTPAQLFASKKLRIEYKIAKFEKTYKIVKEKFANGEKNVEFTYGSIVKLKNGGYGIRLKGKRGNYQTYDCMSLNLAINDIVSNGFVKISDIL